MTNYRHLEEAELKLCQGVLLKHHQHLKGHRVEFVFRDKASTENGKTTLGKARRISGLQAFLSDAEAQPYFVIELAEDAWDELTPDARLALIDHELMHCRIKHDDEGEAIPFIAPHDLEEFAAIVKRHGLWKPDVEYFAQAIQLVLPGTAGEASEFNPNDLPAANGQAELDAKPSRVPTEAGA